MGTHADILASGARFTLGYAELLAKGVDAKIASSKPIGQDGKLIDCNHPLFLFGHLGLYHARICDTLHLPAPDGIRAPQGWEELFKAGAPCHHDPERTKYPAWDTVWQHYHRSAQLAIEVMAQAHDAQLVAPTADEARRARFPFVGSAINFVLLGHPMMHLGQISTWRRCMGLPSAM